MAASWDHERSVMQIFALIASLFQKKKDLQPWTVIVTNLLMFLMFWKAFIFHFFHVHHTVSPAGASYHMSRFEFHFNAVFCRFLS